MKGIMVFSLKLKTTAIMLIYVLIIYLNIVHKYILIHFRLSKQTSKKNRNVDHTLLYIYSYI